VLDAPENGFFGNPVRRDFAGVMAVRLVSTSRASRRPQAPTYVFLKRNAVTKRGAARKSMTGEVSAARYYNYHNPHATRASDSFLEREFHTEYTYREGEPDRRTYESRERRSQFHFPEMKASEPTDPASKMVSRFLGGAALADVPETRFEAQIKFYPRVAQARCLTVTTRLDETDDASLKVTMTDLDYPSGMDAFGGSETWVITWKKPVAPNARGASR
jgi:hypothetical protein